MALASAPTLSLGQLQVQSETLSGTEDQVLRLKFEQLLANDHTPNASADPERSALTITAVGAPEHGQVSLVAGEVWFVPDADFHGNAKFTYTVTDQYGLSAQATATLSIAAVNDAPVTQGESASTAEDTAILFTQAQLLANDRDVDTATDGQVLRISRVSAATHGSATLLESGDIRFVPDADYHGPAQFTYWVSDAGVSDGSAAEGAGAETQATVRLTVTAVNDAPVAQADQFESEEDHIVTLSQAALLANDTDNDMITDGDVLSVKSVGNAQHGTVRLLSSLDGSAQGGQIEFVPDTNYHGLASFEYTTRDSFGATSTSTVTLQIGALNDTPVVQNEAATTVEDQAYLTSAAALLANDSDVDMATDGQVLSVIQVQNAQHGVVSMDVNGRITFTPDRDFHGTASFDYVVSDGTSSETATGQSGQRTGRVTLEVQAVNDAPVTQNEDATTAEDTAILFTQAQLLANDSDVDTATDGQVLRISRVSAATHGSVTLLESGDIRFVPDADYHGPAEFTYWVSDGSAAEGAGDETPASVRLTIAAVNDAPVAQGEATSTAEDTRLLIDATTLLTNDSDVDTVTDGQVLTLSAVSALPGQTHGSVSLITQANGTQQVLYTPDANYHGTAVFSYTVSDGQGGFATAQATVTVNPVNDAPVAQNEAAQSDEDIGLVFAPAQLLANDSDVDTATDGQTLSISRVGQAEHGTVWLDAQGNLRFVPDPNYHGPAQFTYWVSDGAAAEGAGAETPATVCLTIAAVNDMPVAQGEVTNTAEDTRLLIAAATLLANDSDVDTATDGQILRLASVSNAVHCSVSLSTLADGTQRVSLVPEQNYHGVASFAYTVDDGQGGRVVATAVINLSAVNDAPVTTGETASGQEDQVLVFASKDLLVNDSDVDTATDGQVLRISRVGDASHGTVSLDAQGQVRFVPDANYHGPAQFTYWVSDGAGAEVPATVSLNLLAVNDLPVVQGESVNAAEDTTLLFDPATLLANDSDVDTATDGQTLRITGVGAATHGTVRLLPSGQIEFVPEANFFGVASYQYTVSDMGAGSGGSNGGSTVGTVVLNLASLNDTPVAANDSLASTAEDTALHISLASLLGNDSDADSRNAQWGGVNDVLSVFAVGNAAHGTVAMVNGEVLFTPDANYHGPASFTYQVRDASGALSQAVATFSITAANDSPVAVGESVSSDEDTALVISPSALLQNDWDVDTATDGQILSITSVFNAQHGAVSLTADGSISFVPERDFYGTASFDYTVSDGQGGSRTATTTLVLAAVNDAPQATGETVSSREDETLTFTASALLQNERDVDNATSDLRISRVQSGVGGVAVLDASGNVVFTPTRDFNGTASLTYWVKDPSGAESSPVTTTIQVSAVNDAPWAQGETVLGAIEDATLSISKAMLLANDGDVDNAASDLSVSWVGNASNGSVSLDGGGNVVFTPWSNFNGYASFEYSVRDPAGLESVQVKAWVPVTAVNDVPIAVDDQFTTYSNSTMTFVPWELTSNDRDADGDNLSVSAVRGRTNGQVSIVDGYYVQFIPTPGFTGKASFDYLADDGHGRQAWATAFVDVRPPPNQYPTADLTTGNGWGYYPYKTWVQISFTISDDGDPAAVQMSLLSAQARYSDGAWVDVRSNTGLSRSGGGGYFRTDGYFDLLQTTWQLVDNRGLANTWHYNITGDTNATGPWYFLSSSYSDHYGYYYPPLVLDLNNDGVHFTSVQNSQVSIDINADGVADKIAWAGNDDGVLVWDKDHNRQISDASEFGFQALKAGAQTDLEGLRALDSNGNGLLDAKDAAFADFAVWQDANGNGVSDAGEFKTLTELGIASIGLTSNGQMRHAGTLLAGTTTGETDATVMGEAAFTRTDGSTGVVADTMLAYELGRAEAAQAQIAEAAQMQTAEVIRQAMLFNQMCNTAAAGVADAAPLGFVPLVDEQPLLELLAASNAVASHTAASHAT